MLNKKSVFIKGLGLSMALLIICVSFALPISNNNKKIRLAEISKSANIGNALTLIGGTVYKEFKQNGTADSGDPYRFDELGIVGTIVNVYGDDMALLGTTTSITDGSWSVDIINPSGSNSVLLEFIPPSGYLSGPHGGNNKTALVKALLGSMDNDFTVGRSEDHCQDNPIIATACFPGPNSPASSIVTIEFEDSKDFSDDQDTYAYSPFFADATTNKSIADEDETGFISGLAWDKTHMQIYSASFMKLSASAHEFNNVGHIYKTDPVTEVTTLWLDLELEIGSNSAGSDLFGDGTANNSTDQDVYTIGHIGFTDIEIAEDDSEVYVFNAFDRKVYIIPINLTTGAAIVTDITSVQIPAICTGSYVVNIDNTNYTFEYAVSGGLGIHDGIVYASTTCSGPAIIDLEGAVYSFDPSTTSPTVSQELSLDYANWVMPDVLIGGGGFGGFLTNTLAPWSLGLSNVVFGNSDFAPWAMDIEFDIHPNGNVGMNIITKNRGIDATEDFNDPTNGGYMSKASLNSTGGWDIESNGDTGPFSTGLNKSVPSDAQINTYQRGQVDASFYHGEGLEGPSANGGALIIPGFKEIMTSNTDNIEGNYDSGFSFHDVSNGLKTRDVNLLQGGNVGFSKGNSWGDLQAMCELPPIEIGNYVWIDSDSDGIQDPDEKGQDGIQVHLWKDQDGDKIGDLLIGTATTDVNGFYFFGGAQWENIDVDSLIPFMDYELRIGLEQAKTIQSQIVEFTIANSSAHNFDSDFQDTLINSAQWGSVKFSTTHDEFVFHDFDAGLIELCSMEILSTTPSSCNSLNDTYSLEVTISYRAAPSSDKIVIIADGSTQEFDALGGCETETFTLINLYSNGKSNRNVFAYFKTNEGCSTKLNGAYDAPVACDLNCESEVKGKAFIDFNGDGKDNDDGPGLPNVEVLLFGSNNGNSELIGSVFTDAYGNYTFTGVADGAYRVEFILPLDENKFPLSGGMTNTTVQFIQAPECAVDLGVAIPNTTCYSDLYVSCFRNGARDHAGNIGEASVIRLTPDEDGMYSKDGTVGEIPNMGSVWGISVQKSTGDWFAASAIHRHMDMGPGGEGGIYKNGQLWADLDDGSYNVDFGTLDRAPYDPNSAPDAYGTNGSLLNTLGNGDPTQDNYDKGAYAQVGKIAIGDIDISNNDSILFLTNLFDRKLYALQINNDGSPGDLNEVGGAPWLDEGFSCTSGVSRPWGLAVDGTKTYVGVICTGENVADNMKVEQNSVLAAFVFCYNAETNSWTDNILDDGDNNLTDGFDLSFDRGFSLYVPIDNTDDLEVGGQWEAWNDSPMAIDLDDPRFYSADFGYIVTDPQPILADLEIDPYTGVLVMGFVDRGGMQFGQLNNFPDPANNLDPMTNTPLTPNNADLSIYPAGDLLIASPSSDGSVFEVESNAAIFNGSICGANPSNNEGPNGGEFFDDLDPENDGSYHEINYGGIKIISARNEVLSVGEKTVENTEGAIAYSLSDGTKNYGLPLIPFNGPTDIGKGTNLGDISGYCAAPFDIGNYAWKDENFNGIQDPNEPVIEGLTVSIYDCEGDEIASTTTDENGEYFFNSEADTLLPNIKYYLTFGKGGQYDTLSKIFTIGDDKYELTEAFTGMAPNNGLNDSNVEIANAVNDSIDGCAYIEIVTPDYGESDYSYDIGLTPKIDVAITQVLDPDYDLSNLQFDDLVKFKITVYNQSSITIDSVSLVDYVPDGFEFVLNTVGNELWEMGQVYPEALFTDGIAAYGKDSLCIYLKILRDTDPNNWINVVEISEAYIQGEEFEDCDSPLNRDPDDNVGSLINTPADDYVDGDGSATEPDGVADTDQDNVDPATVPICDLALVNVIDEIPSSVQVGDTIKYAIVIENQGTAAATNIHINYTIPDGFDFVSSNTGLEPAWSEGVDAASTQITDELSVGEKDTLCIYLTVQNVLTDSVNANSWTTIAEISGFEDPDDLGVSKSDIDSTPDDDFTNDPGGNPDDETDDETGGDGTGDPNDPEEDTDPELDEDDHDPAIIYVCDVATIIDTEEEGPFSYGDTIKYTVEVYNQGNGDITNVDIQNLFGDGLAYIDDAVNEDAGWEEEDEGELSLLVEEVLEPGDIDTICLYMELVMSESPNEESWLQNVEVIGFEDPDDEGESKKDIDSTPDEDPTNDPGGNPDDPTDDVVDGDGSGDPEDEDENSDPNLDEDDQDTEDIEICDLALTNELVSEEDGTSIGDTLKYEVVVYNQGNTEANSVSIDYHIPNGLSYLDVNDDLVPDWAEEGGNLASITIVQVLSPGDSDTICIYLALENVESNSVTQGSWTTIAEITEFTDEEDAVKTEDVDSTPDGDPANDPGGNPDDDTDNETGGDGSGDPEDPEEDSDPGLDEDDHDPAILYVCDVATIIDTEEEGPFSYGDTIKYTVEVYNQGNGNITNVDIQNLFGDGLAYIDDEVNEGAGWKEEDEGELSLLVEEVLEPGDIDTICLYMELVMSESPSEESWLQNVEVTSFEDPDDEGESKEDIDSNPDEDPTNDPGGNPDDSTDDVVDGDGSGDPEDEDENSDPNLDEDDQDTEDIEICDLALTNELVSEEDGTSIGDTLKYEVVVYNQGNTEANSVSIDYHIPNGLSYLDVNDDLVPDWTEEGVTLASITIDEVLSPGESDTVCIYLAAENVESTSVAEDSWTTIAEITEFTDEEDAVKTEDVDSTPDGDPANDPGGNPDDDTDNETGGDGSGDPEDPEEDSDPGLDEDDHDSAIIYVCDVATIIDTEDEGPHTYGDTVKYEVLVYNQGNGDITNVSLQNLFGKGLEYIDDVVNTQAGWVEEEEGELSLLIDEILEPGEVDTICLYMELQMSEMPSEDSWLQNVEVVSFEDPEDEGESKTDLDSTPDEDPDNDPGGNPDDPTDDEVDGDGSGDPEDEEEDSNPILDEDDQDTEDLEICDLALVNKIVDVPTNPIVGDTIKYEVIVYNQGNTIANAVDINYMIPIGLDYLPVNGTLSPSWNEDSDDLATIQTEEILAPGESDTVCIYLSVNDLLTDEASEDTWVTIAEISSFSDEEDEVKLEDVDSTPDEDFNNDNGGNPHDETDNEVNGNGEGDPNEPSEDTDPLLDEDDHDPADLYVCDVATIINTDDDGPFSYGDTVKYYVEVHNQGNGDITNIDLQNLYGDGLKYLANTDNIDAGWVQDEIGELSLLVEDVIEPNDTVTVCLYMEVQPVEELQENTWVQNVEVTSFEDPEDEGTPKSDVDSAPDDDPGNDPGGNPDDETDDEIGGDGSGNPEDPIEDTNEDLDEDDQDVEEIAVFDLALKKTVENEGPYKVGDTVEYEIHLYNQGNVDASNIVITDYLNGGFAFSAANSGWMQDDNLLSYNYDQELEAGASATVKLYLITQVDSDPNVADWYNYAEISLADDDGEASNAPPKDADSYPDDNNTNDNGGMLLPDTDDDDEINEDSDLGDDEDDHDVEKVIVGYDLAIDYVAIDSVPMSYGDTVCYQVIVANQGGLVVSDVEVSDTIPAGLMFPSGANPDWKMSDHKATTMFEEPLMPGSSVVKVIKLIVDQIDPGGEDEYESIVEITDFMDEDGEEPDSEDYDSTPDDDPKNDPPGEDDHDMQDLKVFDLALKMKIDSMPPVLPVVPGDVMKFIVITSNQGNTEATGVELSNYIMPDNLKLNSSSTSLGWSEVNDSVNKLVLTDPLLPGEVDTTCIYLEVVSGAMSDIISWSEISGSDQTDDDCFDIDSTPDDVIGNDEGGMINDPTDDHVADDGTDGDGDGVLDEDDHDPANLLVQDLALLIWADQKDPVLPKQDVKFIIQVINQGNIPNHDIKIADYIPSGFTLSENDTNEWNEEGDNTVTKILDATAYMGDTIETCIILTVNEGVSADELINYAEIVSSLDNEDMSLDERDIDSSPDVIDDNDTGGEPSDLVDCDPYPNVIGDDNNTAGAGVLGEDEDDHDPAWVPVFDIATIIYTDHTQPIIPGDEIKFLVDIHNQGNMAAADILLSIYMPEGFVLSENDDADWDVMPDGNLSNIVKEQVLPDDMKQLCLLLEVVDDFVLTDLVPQVEISSASDTLGIVRDDFDLDSDPDGMSGNDMGGLPNTDDDDALTGNGMEGDDEDDHDPVVPPVLDLAIKIESTDMTSQMPGDVVKFLVSIYNQGSLTPSEFTVENYVPEGLIFNSGGDNLGWVSQGDNASYLYTDDLLPGSSDTICVWLEVSPLAHPENVVTMVEITNIIDEYDIDVSERDIDSKSDASNENDKGNDLYSLEDNKIMENGRSGNDEDDHDQAFVLVCNPMLCIGQVNLSLDANCEAVLSASMFMEGPVFPDKFYDFYTIDYLGNEHLVSSFDFSDVGQTYKIKIDNPICNNSCWGEVRIEAKVAPVIECTRPDTVITCLELANFPGPPVMRIGCYELPADSLEIISEVEMELPECSGDTIKRIVRHYQAVDVNGNRSNICRQELNIVKLDTDSIKFPPNSTQVLACNAEFFVIDKDNLTPDVVPYYYTKDGVGVPLYPTPAESGCNIFVDFKDEVILDTPCKKQVIRTWTVQQWHCNEEFSEQRVQLVSLVDAEGPVLSCPDTLMTVSTSNTDCLGRVNLPEILAIDSCSSIKQIDMTITGSGTDASIHHRFYEDQNGGDVLLPVGENIVKYTAYDECHNSSSCTVIVNVVDELPPVIVCQRNTVVSLSNTGEVHVPAAAFDDGSYDDCGPVTLKVRRMNLACQSDESDSTSIEFGDYTVFCCEDVGQEVMVVLRAYDTKGRYNECMVEVRVDDKNLPSIVAPPDITVDCEFVFDRDDLSIFGKVATSETARELIVIDAALVEFGGPARDGLAIGSCNVPIIESRDFGDVELCGKGIITRSFSATNNGTTVSAEQKITIRSILEFDPTRIIWPRDTSLLNTTCSKSALDPNNLPEYYDRPVLDKGVCELLGISISNEELYETVVGGDACFKLLRTWSVIDWCDRDPKTGEPARWDSVQVIKVENTVGPVIDCPATVATFNSFDANCNPVRVSLSATATDDCTPSDQLYWTWEIDLDKNGSIDTSGVGNSVDAAYIPGEHKITWYAEDLCGNISLPCSQNFEITNDKSAPAICIDNVATELSPMDLNGDGIPDAEMVEIWAKDIAKEGTHPCGHEVLLSFDQAGLELSRFYDCDDIGLNPVELWVTDLVNGGQNFCTTVVDVQDNNDVDVCTGSGTGLIGDVSGLITTETGEQISEAEVRLEGSELPSQQTNLEGSYAFLGMPMGGDYLVLPSKDKNVINGISTLDLVLIQKHILGLQVLDSPYKIVAADINKSNSVTGIDIVELRKLILGDTDALANNTSWRFIDEDYSFPDPFNPWVEAFPEDYSILNLSQDMYADFVGIKIGDVSGNARGSELIRSEVRSSETPLVFNATIEVQDQLHTVYINSNDFKEVNGYQLSIEFDHDKFDYIGLESNALEINEEHLGLNYVDRGIITMSWHSEKPITIDSEQELYRLHFVSKFIGVEKLQLEASSVVTMQEAYVDGEVTDNVRIDMKESGSAEMQLMQNEPNPWRESTAINFELPEEGKVELKLFDSNGKLIRDITDVFGAGYNTFEISRSIIPIPGIYLYELHYNGQKKYKRMIVLD